jgi:hypothetical protein
LKTSIFLLLLLPTALFAQRLTVERDTIDCGKTGFRQPVTATFHLQNKGSHSLNIEKVATDCGCTTAKSPKRAGAGQRFEITLTYDANQLGHYRKQAAVYCKDTPQPLILTMRGQVKADVHDYSPQYPYDMGGLRCDQGELFYDDVRQGETPAIELHLVNDGEGPMEPNLLHLPPYLTAVCQPERIMPNQTATLTVTLNSDRLHDFGLTQTTIHLAKHLGEKVSPDNELAVSAIMLPPLSAQGQASGPQPSMRMPNGDTLNLGPFGKKQKTEGSLVIENTGQAPLVVTSMQLLNRGLRATLSRQTLKPGQSARLTVVASKEELLKSRTAPRILLVTNDPIHPKTIVKVFAQ